MKYRKDPMAMFKAFSRVTPFTEEDVATLSTPTRLAFEAIKNGSATEDQFDELAVSLNTTKVRAENIHPDLIEICIAAQAAADRAKERYLKTGRWGFDGPALTEIPPALDLYDEIMRGSNALFMQKALLEQHRRVMKVVNA